MRSKLRGRLVDASGGRITDQGFLMQHLPGGSPLQLPAENPTPQICLLSHTPLRAREVVLLSPSEASTPSLCCPQSPFWRFCGASVTVQNMEVVGGKDEPSNLNHSSSGQKCERALAIKVEDVRPWGVGSKFSAAYADVSGRASPSLHLNPMGSPQDHSVHKQRRMHCLASMAGSECSGHTCLSEVLEGPYQ